MINKKAQQSKKMGRPSVTPGIIGLTIRTQHEMGMRITEIAYLNNVSVSTVHRVIRAAKKAEDK